MPRKSDDFFLNSGDGTAEFDDCNGKSCFFVTGFMFFPAPMAFFYPAFLVLLRSSFYIGRARFFPVRAAIEPEWRAARYLHGRSGQIF